MAYDEVLAGRVRDCLREVAGVSEKKMFGGLAFMAQGHLTVGVYGDGLIARIGAEGMDAAVAEPGVRVVGVGREASSPTNLADRPGPDQAVTMQRLAGVSRLSF
jgi:hypothetical protein